MALRRLWVERYRSLAALRVTLDRLTVIQGENATGKTNVYRALHLLSCGASGRLATTLLAEGGMPSALTATDDPTARRRVPVRMRLGVQLDELCYEVALGLPAVDATVSPFALDAEVKEERAWLGPRPTRHGELLDRAGDTATARDVDGGLVRFDRVLDRHETALAQLGEPGRFPELFDLRERIRTWRFYHQIPSGPDAPARQARPGVRTPVLANDGSDLAAALLTIVDMGTGPALQDAIERAFPGSALAIDAERGTFRLGLSMPGIRRPLAGAELSDGTLRYLSLVAALLSPRPPELLVLNEPETSLHESLIAPLAELIVEALRGSQVVITTHSATLAHLLAERTGHEPIRLVRTDGVTGVADDE